MLRERLYEGMPTRRWFQPRYGETAYNKKPATHANFSCLECTLAMSEERTEEESSSESMTEWSIPTASKTPTNFVSVFAWAQDRFPGLTKEQYQEFHSITRLLLSYHADMTDAQLIAASAEARWEPCERQSSRGMRASRCAATDAMTEVLTSYVDPCACYALEGEEKRALLAQIEALALEHPEVVEPAARRVLRTSFSVTLRDEDDDECDELGRREPFAMRSLLGLPCVKAVVPPDEYAALQERWNKPSKYETLPAYYAFIIVAYRTFCSMMSGSAHDYA